MAQAKEGLLSDGDDDAAPDADKKFIKEELAQAEKWGAEGVSVDAKTLEGRKANRGFTIAMGSSKPVDAADLRRDKRAQTLPATTRRGDFILSNESQKALMQRNEDLKARLRRGSLSVACTVVEEATLKQCWETHAVCHVYGKMSTCQKSGDERERAFFSGDKMPSSLPPIISCTKGAKGHMDTTPNQDNFSITYLHNGYAIACCMDGHGLYGHKVSTRTVQTVPYFLVNSANFPDKMSAALTEAFEKAQKDVTAAAVEETWDVQASGSTAVACVWKGNKLWTANAGDSRCVVGSETTRKLIFETKDHKPDDAEEKARIESMGGEVRSQTYPDGWTVHRIFVKGQDYPGLCMTRTLGDDSIKAHGVVAVPECKEFEVDLADKPFIILASDGVWEFLDSEFVVKAVAKKILSDGAERTIQKLQREARKRWKQEEGDYCDDITSVLIQLRPPDSPPA